MNADWAFICRSVAFPTDGFGVSAVNIGIREFSGPSLPILIPECVYVVHVALDADDDPGNHEVRAVHVDPDGQTVCGYSFRPPLRDNRPGERRQGATLVWEFQGLPLERQGLHAIRAVADGRTIHELTFTVSADPALSEVGCGY